MSEIDDRLRRDGRRLRERAVGASGTEDALAEVRGAPAGVVRIHRPHPRIAWLATAAALLLVLIGVGATLFLGGEKEPPASTPGAAAVLPRAVPSSDSVATSTPDPPEDSVAVTLPTPATPRDEVATSAAPGPSSPPTPNGTAWPRCNYTDPGHRPITVSRALSCADGTAVSVEGIVVTAPDGTTYLCGSVSVMDGAACDGPALRLVGVVPGADARFGISGVKQGDDLLLAGG